MVEKRWINSNMGYIETLSQSRQRKRKQGLIVIWDILKQKEQCIFAPFPLINSNMGYIET